MRDRRARLHGRARHADARRADALGGRRAGSGVRCRWSPAGRQLAVTIAARRSFVRVSRQRRAGGLARLLGDRARPAARAAHRSALRLSVVHGSGAARRAGRRRRLRRRPARASGSVVTPTSRSATGRSRSRQGSRRVVWRRVDDRTLESTITRQRGGAYRVGARRSGRPHVGGHRILRPRDGRPARPTCTSSVRAATSRSRRSRKSRSRRAPTTTSASPAFDLVYSVGGGAEKVVPFTTLGGTNLARVGSRMLAAEDLDVKPGDVIAYYARARDVAARQAVDAVAERDLLPRGEAVQRGVLAGPEPGDGRGDRHAARRPDLGAEGHHQRDLEPRAARGRRTIARRDIKDVADAQVGAEGARRAVGRRSAAATAPVARRRSRSSDAGRSLRPSPVTRGDRRRWDARCSSWTSRRPSGAIPHEMAALNALLQAQAETSSAGRCTAAEQRRVERRERQRQGQDLSNLFDRELKRQQQTNYENKVADRDAARRQEGDSALDRIRDLARAPGGAEPPAARSGEVGAARPTS